MAAAPGSGSSRVGGALWAAVHIARRAVRSRMISAGIRRRPRPVGQPAAILAAESPHSAVSLAPLRWWTLGAVAIEGSTPWRRRTAKICLFRGHTRLRVKRQSRDSSAARRFAAPSAWYHRPPDDSDEDAGGLALPHSSAGIRKDVTAVTIEETDSVPVSSPPAAGEGAAPPAPVAHRTRPPPAPTPASSRSPRRSGSPRRPSRKPMIPRRRHLPSRRSRTPEPVIEAAAEDEPSPVAAAPEPAAPAAPPVADAIAGPAARPPASASMPPAAEQTAARLEETLLSQLRSIEETFAPSPGLPARLPPSAPRRHVVRAAASRPGRAARALALRPRSGPPAHLCRSPRARSGAGPFGGRRCALAEVSRRAAAPGVAGRCPRRRPRRSATSRRRCRPSSPRRRKSGATASAPCRSPPSSASAPVSASSW